MTAFEKTVKYLAICLAVFIICTIASAVLGVFGAFSFFGDDYHGEVIDDVKTFDDYIDIRKIDVELNDIGLEILEGSEYKIEKKSLRKDVRINFSNGELKIKENGSSWWGGSKGTVVIYVPANVILDELDIDMGAGRTDIEGVEARSLTLDMGAGTVFMDNCKFDKADIEGGAGRTDITDSTFKNLEMQTGVGSTKIEGYILGNSKIEAGVGSLKMNLYGSKNSYTIRTEKGIGSVRIDGNKAESTYGSGENFIQLEGGVGSIDIDFKEID